MAAPATSTRSSTSTAATTTWRRTTYDAKWGISFGEIGQAQVLGQGRRSCSGRSPGRSRASLEIGAGTGYFSLNLLQAGVIGARDLHRHLARACSPRSSATRAELGLDVETACLRRRRAAVRRRVVRPRARPRRAAPPARPRARVRRVRAACCGPAARCSSPASRRATGDRIAAVPKRAAWRLAPLWRSACASRARAAAPASRRRGGDDHALEARRRRPRVRARRPRAPGAAAAGFADVARARRGAAGQLVRLVQPHAGGERRARPTCPGPWIQYAYRGYLAAPARRPPRCWSRACRRGSSTT